MNRGKAVELPRLLKLLCYNNIGFAVHIPQMGCIKMDNQSIQHIPRNRTYYSGSIFGCCLRIGQVSESVPWSQRSRHTNVSFIDVTASCFSFTSDFSLNYLGVHGR